MAISEKLQTRLNNYTIIENGIYKLTISSGNDINVSERLFLRAKELIEATNHKIKDGELQINENGNLVESCKLHVKSTRSGVCRCGASSYYGHSQDEPKVEKEQGLYVSKTTITYNQEQALEYYGEFVYGGPPYFSSLFGIAIRGVGAVSLFKEVNIAFGVAIFSLELMLWMESMILNGLAEKMFNAIKMGEIRVESVQDNLTGNFTTTVYDKNGNYIGRHTYRGIPPGQ